MKITKVLVIIFAVMTMTLSISCNKGSLNPNIPNVPINITVDPNSTMIQELNTVGGWVYLEEKPSVYVPAGSRGIIVYRLDITEFRAYERQPPNDPNGCCTSGLCTRIVVGEHYPLAVDTCLNTKFLLIDGSIVEGDAQFSLIQYAAVYDGNLLHIYN